MSVVCRPSLPRLSDLLSSTCLWISCCCGRWQTSHAWDWTVSHLMPCSSHLCFGASLFAEHGTRQDSESQQELMLGVAKTLISGSYLQIIFLSPFSVSSKHSPEMSFLFLLGGRAQETKLSIAFIGSHLITHFLTNSTSILTPLSLCLFSFLVLQSLTLALKAMSNVLFSGEHWPRHIITLLLN